MGETRNFKVGCLYVLRKDPYYVDIIPLRSEMPRPDENFMFMRVEGDYVDTINECEPFLVLEARHEKRRRVIFCVLKLLSPRGLAGWTYVPLDVLSRYRKL